MNVLITRISTAALSGIIAMGLAQTAGAVNLVQNGGFEATTSSGSDTTAPSGQLGFNTTATDWSTTGYNFLFAPGTADTTGALGSFGVLTLWGPNDGSANGLPPTSPAGGNFVAANGAFEVGAINQTITGLIVGQTYQLSFWWAAAQQHSFSGPTTEGWDVSLGGQTHDTAVLNNPSHGFSGWMAQTFDYTATSTSEVLSFLAVGTPSGEPPMSLLDGVDLEQQTVPDASSTILLAGLGIFGLLVAPRLRRQH
jgi:hypothetical protein